MFIAGVAILLGRWVVNFQVGGSAGNYYGLLFEDGVFRIYANYLHVIQNTGALQSVPLFGCGLVIWLPIYWTRLSSLTRWVFVATTPPLIILFFVDNFIELRCYAEIIPMFAAGFGQVLLMDKKESGVSA